MYGENHTGMRNENNPDSELKYLKVSDTHDKIHINNNWTDARNVGICSGSGNYTDPYVIKDLIIDGGGIGAGILIEYTKDYFKIENCTIYNCQIGIQLSLVNNGTIYRNNCSNNENGIFITQDAHPVSDQYNKNNTIIENIANDNTDYGIWIMSPFCDDCKIIGNILNKNQYGLYFHGANKNNCTITGNIMNRNSIGIYIVCSGNNSLISNNTLENNRNCAIAFGGIGYVLTGNLMKGSGLVLGYASIETLSLLNIDTSNLVNNKFVYYYINKSSLKQEDFNNAGQIFLINCINSVISDRNVSNSTQGISLLHSNNITVTNVNSSYNQHGIYVYNTTNSIFIRNILNECDYGIYMQGQDNTISENEITNNGYGIDLKFGSHYNIISENYINDNAMGIWIMGSRSNTIFGNIIKDNIYFGLYLVGGLTECRNSFFLNFFIRNGIHVRGTNNYSNENAWNNTDVGNYWDNYTGSDTDGDGIGDTPHIVDYSSLTLDYLPIVDNDPPIITIIKPINNSKIGILAPSFNIRVEEKYLDVMWYTLDGGLNNYTFTENGTINQGAWDALNFDHNILRFYAVDKVGNISFMDVVVVKIIPETELIPGYYLFVLFCVISIIGVILIVISRKSYSLKGLKKSY